MDFKDVLASAKAARRTVPICLRGDLVAEWEDLERQLADAERNNLGGIEDASPAVVIAERMEALREQMAAATYTFVVQALPGPKYRELKAAHPPRQNEDGAVIDDDRYLDANVETFLEPLFRACLVDPVLDDVEWAMTNMTLSDAQYNQLVNAAFAVNKGGVSVPFSPAASRHLRSTAPG